MEKSAFFLDRDGVINVDRGYISLWDDFEFLPGVVEALRRISNAGFELIIVTNQSGIGRGYYSEDAFLALTERISTELAYAGVRLAQTYYCPHAPSGKIQSGVGCECRKPAPGMILRALVEHGIHAATSVIVGDKASDLEAGLAAGIPVRCFVGRPIDAMPGAATHRALGLADFVDHFLSATSPVCA